MWSNTQCSAVQCSAFDVVFVPEAHLPCFSGCDPTSAAVRTSYASTPWRRRRNLDQLEAFGRLCILRALLCCHLSAALALAWSGDPRIDDANPRRVALQKAHPREHPLLARALGTQNRPSRPGAWLSGFLLLHRAFIRSVQVQGTFRRTISCRCPQARRQHRARLPLAPPTTVKCVQWSCSGAATVSSLRQCPTMSMSLDEIRNVILLFSNPSWKGVGTISNTVIRNITALSSEMAYSARFAGNTTVLSTRYTATSNGLISGLLYVPDLPYGDSCIHETAPHVPLSVVRQANLPPTNFHLIAIAPWVNGRCAAAYMDAASTAPVRGFLFYIPGNASASPPPADSSDWYIDDSTDWMAKTNYPVYALSGMVGEVMMQHLSLYSGNMTEVPFGRNISERFLADTGDYLRIWTELAISSPPMAFSTWVYVLIIIGVLLTVVATTSLLMHLAQGRRRLSLRRRVIAGEVNLEAMGIKHLTVPLQHIQGFPLFTYHYEPDTSSPPLSPRSVKATRSQTRTRSLDQTESVTAVARSATVSELGLGSQFAASTTTATDYQPVCEICLDSFENRVTVIRELPCGHIFHPECIDEFLHEISSLCPICKTNMLPKGYCPKITNSMVRRERAVRRLRGRIEQDDDDPGQTQGWWGATKGRLFGAHGGSMSSTSTELQETQPRPKRRPPQRERVQLQPGDDPQTAPTAVTRERMRELAGFEPDYGEGGLTLWKRVRTRVFPGFD